MFAILVLSFAITYAYRWSVLNRKQTKDGRTCPTPPLLLVGPLIIIAVAFSTLVKSLSILAIAIYAIVLELGLKDNGAGNLHQFIADYLGIELAITIVLIVGTVLMAMRPVAANALYMGIDVAEFFRTTPKSAPSSREILKCRFIRVLDWLKGRENPSRVIFVTHSQGSVLAIDAFADAEISKMLKPLTTELVTMGSPFSHLYQRYFPSWFPGFSDERWRVLKKTISRWHNIYRADDYIGTEIKGNRENFPQNIPIETGGHTGYWNDAQVRSKLEDTLQLSKAAAYRIESSSQGE